MTPKISKLKLYCCYICGAKFSVRDMCKQHVLSHNRKEIDTLCKSELNKSSDSAVQQEAKEEGIVDIKVEIKEEVRDEPMEHAEELLRTHQKQRGDPYKCCHYDNGFSLKSNLVSHQSFHTSENPFNCNRCDISCTYKEGFEQHMGIHNREKPCQCTKCDSSFDMRGALIEHHEIHPGEKPQECSYCGRYFAQNSSLEKHQRIHTGEKPYQCDIKFTQKRSLIDKWLSTGKHTGEKEF